MCQIDFTIQTNTNPIQAAEGRYKLQGTVTWTLFIIDINDSKTPNITTNGNYDLEVRIQDSSGFWSNWFTVVSGFQIGNCNPQ